MTNTTIEVDEKEFNRVCWVAQHSKLMARGLIEDDDFDFGGQDEDIEHRYGMHSAYAAVVDQLDCLVGKNDVELRARQYADEANVPLTYEEHKEAVAETEVDK